MKATTITVTKDKKLKTYLITYEMQGSRWSEEIEAESFADAQRRLLAIKATATLEGEVKAKLPVPAFFKKFLPTPKDHQS